MEVDLIPQAPFQRFDLGVQVYKIADQDRSQKVAIFHA